MSRSPQTKELLSNTGSLDALMKKIAFVSKKLQDANEAGGLFFSFILTLS
jgi:hypothetical protein